MRDNRKYICCRIEGTDYLLADPDRAIQLLTEMKAEKAAKAEQQKKQLNG